MPRYKPYDYKQNKMVVVNYEAQLQPGTFEHALHHLIDNKLDLSIFDTHYHNDDTGRPAYDPAILLKIVLFAYSKGITSSREIEWNCKHNVMFQALSCDTAPHWTTVAHFMSSHHDEVEASARGQRGGQTDLQPPDVGGGAGVREHHCQQAIEAFQPA